jgi:hypothetical protein
MNVGANNDERFEAIHEALNPPRKKRDYPPAHWINELKKSAVSLDLVSMGEKDAIDILYSSSITDSGILFLEGIVALLNAPENTLTEDKAAFFAKVINSPPSITAFPLLHWAVEVNFFPAVEKLVQYGANVNSIFKEKTPLDRAKTSEIYDFLTSRGATHIQSEKNYIKTAPLELFLKRFGTNSPPVLTKRVLDNLIEEPDRFIAFFNAYPSAKTELKTPALKEQFYSLLFKPHLLVKVKKTLIEIYHETIAPFDPTFHYDEPLKIMYSQRGFTCGSDTLFTILFECTEFQKVRDLIKPMVVSSTHTATNETCVLLPTTNANSNRALKERYLGTITAAKERYNRMASINITKARPGTLRRTHSVANLKWTEMHKPLNITEYGEGLQITDMAIFCENLLQKNMLNVKDLPLFSVSLFNPASPIDLSKVCAFIVRISNLLEPIEKTGHFIGFFKNASDWFFVDNEVGYIHKMKDLVWFNTIFLPRLFSSQSLGKRTLTTPEESVFFVQDGSLMEPYQLSHWFLTLGKSSYPNVRLPDNLAVLPIWSATHIMTISKESVAAITSATRRFQRRKVRRTRRKRRTNFPSF